jgi:hypothetical protein
MNRLLDAHVESSHTVVLRYMGRIAQMRAAQMPNRKLSLLLLLILFPPTPEERSLNAKPYSSARPTPRQYAGLRY